jgi:hypothetical protein
LDDPAWGDPALATQIVPHPSWPSIPGAAWISTAYETEPPAGDDSWRRFEDVFTLPCAAYNISAADGLQATSDNAEEFYLNGDFVGSDGEVQGPFVDDYEWNTVIFYPVSPQPGENTLDFIVRNYAQSGGTPSSNPTGLIYALTVDYELPDVVFQPPVTNANFKLQIGTTLPLKFKFYRQDGTLMTDAKDVILEVWEGSCNGMGGLVAGWELGDGVEYLRFDEFEFYYIANFKTKDYDELGEGSYQAIVRDGCSYETILGCFSFEITASKKANRGNKKK